MAEALQEIFLRPVHYPFKGLVNTDGFRKLSAARVADADRQPDVALLDEVEKKALRLFREARVFAGGQGDETALSGEVRDKLEAILRLPVMGQAAEYLQEGLDGDPFVWGTLFGWLFTHALGKAVDEPGFEQQSRSWIDEWLLGKIILRTLQGLGLSEEAAQESVTLIKLLASHQRWFEEPDGEGRTYRVLERLVRDDDVRQFLQVNRYQDLLWFNKETFERLLWWMLAVAAVEVASRKTSGAAEELLSCRRVVEELLLAEERSGYQVEKLLAEVGHSRAE